MLTITHRLYKHKDLVQALKIIYYEYKVRFMDSAGVDSEELFMLIVLDKFEFFIILDLLIAITSNVLLVVLSKES